MSIKRFDLIAWGGGSLCRTPSDNWEFTDAEVTERLYEALMLLADDHEFGATGEFRQDHLNQARSALAAARGES